jgi:hypothetical protein
MKRRGLLLLGACSREWKAAPPWIVALMYFTRR